MFSSACGAIMSVFTWYSLANASLCEARSRPLPIDRLIARRV